MRTRVTVVNDNPEFLEVVHDVLEDERYDATTVDGDRPDALERIRQSKPQVLMIDLRLGADGMHGWDIAQQIRADDEFDGLPVLICSADSFALKEIEEDLAREHHVESMCKPFSIETLTETVDRLAAAAGHA